MAGNGNVFAGNTVTAVLSTIRPTPDLTFTSSFNDTVIYFSHKAPGGENLCSVSNGLRKPVEAVLSLQGVGIPEIWDPLTGEMAVICVASVSGG